MPNRIDTSVDPVQVSGLDPPRQGAPTDAGCSELGKRNDSMLSGRDSGHQPIGRGAFFPHAVQKAPRDADFAPAGRRALKRGLAPVKGSGGPRNQAP
jgi:hypothetical protein